MTHSRLDRIELLHDDVVADATALAALLSAEQRAWRAGRAAASVVDVFARLDAVTLRGVGAAARIGWGAAARARCAGRWGRLVCALDLLRVLLLVHAPSRRRPRTLDAPERFLAHQPRVRALLDAARRAEATRGETRREAVRSPGAPDARGPTHGLDALALLVTRQRRLLDAALRIAERGGFLDEVVGVDDASAGGSARAGTPR